MKITTIGTDSTQPMWPHYTKHITVLAILILSSLSLTGYFIYDFVKEKDKFKAAQTRHTKQVLRATTDIYEQKLQEIITLGRTLASNLTTSKITHEQLIAKLKKILEKRIAIVSAGIAYVPFTHTPDKKLFSQQLFKLNGAAPKSINIETYYDYTESHWYELSQTGKVHWTEPYLEPSLNVLIVRLVIPFFYFDSKTQLRQQKGVITIDLGLKQLQSIVEKLNLDRDSYALMVSGKGTLLAYPTYELVKKQFLIWHAHRVKKDYYVLLI